MSASAPVLVDKRKRDNIRTAIILGLVALAFFVAFLAKFYLR